VNNKIFIFIWVLFFVPSVSGIVGKKIPSVYFNQIFGNLHQTKNLVSASLTTISCGQQLSVLEDSDPLQKNVEDHSNWIKVKIGSFEGFILKELGSEQKPFCLQEYYYDFFDLLDLDLGELYYWGKLYDRYQILRTKIP
jgi:hypothetical protein